jgi:hypothetical protein
VPQEVLLDNARALVEHHDAATREVRFNERLVAFARYWGFRPRACAPYRARTKGKDERGVGYVKRNAIAGHRFESLEVLRAHLARWMREVADTRVHGTTGELPIVRFERAERQALKPLEAKAPFLQVRELARRVHSDACVELDTNRYSVPWRLIGESVTLIVADAAVRVLHAGQQVACHAQSAGRRDTVIERGHLAGIVGANRLGAHKGNQPPTASTTANGRSTRRVRAAWSDCRRRPVPNAWLLIVLRTPARYSVPSMGGTGTPLRGMRSTSWGLGSIPGRPTPERSRRTPAIFRTNSPLSATGSAWCL